MGSTPRIGGIAIFFGCLCAWYSSDNFASSLLGYILLSSLPVLTVGLLVDLYFDIKPIYRLLGASVSSLMAIYFLNAWLSRVDVVIFDDLLLFTPFAIIFTVFATTGVAHAFNLIDGLNGLSLGISLSVSFFLTVIGWITDDTLIVLLCVVFFLSTLGLFVLNYPWGKIFLGDGGAYFQGHCLSWIGILLIVRNPEISPWSILLVFFWPVVETIFSIYRRVYKKKAASIADREHFHQLVYDKIRTFKQFKRSSNFANSFSTLLLLPLFITPSIPAILFTNNTASALSAFIILFGLYIFLYRSLKGSF